MSNSGERVRLRVIVRHTGGLDGRFGIQDKAGALVDGQRRSSDVVTFEVDVTVSVAHERDAPNVRGPYAHGSPDARFLYVSFPAIDGPGWRKRIKVPLSTITWSMIRETGDGCLETEVDGRQSGSVPAVWRPVPAN
jgi:hypothetical protein